MGFEINENILAAIDDYHEKSLFMQDYHFEGNPNNLNYSQLKYCVNDDLVLNVPIYDMLDRKYAAFSSLLEAIYADKDPKGNDQFFPKRNLNEKDSLLLFYLFRLCGSGINYKPKSLTSSAPWGTHGFGNFWIVNELRENIWDKKAWFDKLKALETPFTNNKGYMLPQISYKGQKGGHLKRFILSEALEFIDKLHDFLLTGKKEIIETVEFCNSYIMERGYKRQNFVFSATCADIAEYFPHLIDPYSMIYPGTNAKKCLKIIFNKTKGTNQRTFENEAIQFLSERYKAPPYSVEDSRLCDVIRYLQEYQSKDHIAANAGIVYKNNSSLKEVWGEERYYDFVKDIK